MRIISVCHGNLCSFKAQKIKPKEKIEQEKKLETYKKEADSVLQDGWIIPVYLDEEEQKILLAPELDPLDWLPRGWS